MTDMEDLEEKIKNKIINDEDWAYPYWVDEFKEKYPGISEEDIDEIYFDAIKNKVNSMSISELKILLNQQKKLTDANQNFFIVNLIEEKVASN